MINEDMRNLGIILLVVGLLLLILPKWFMVLVGVVSLAFGILMVLIPEKMIIFFSKFKSKKGE